MIQCRFEDGGNAALRHVTVSSVIIDRKKERILLAKRAPNLPNGGRWCLPGGYLGRDEVTKDAAMREVFEETGYRTEVISLLRLIDTPSRPKEDKQNVEFAYILQALKKEKELDTETTEIRWFNFKDVPPEHWASLPVE